MGSCPLFHPAFHPSRAAVSQSQMREGLYLSPQEAGHPRACTPQNSLGGGQPVPGSSSPGPTVVRPQGPPTAAVPSPGWVPGAWGCLFACQTRTDWAWRPSAEGRHSRQHLFRLGQRVPSTWPFIHWFRTHPRALSVSVPGAGCAASCLRSPRGPEHTRGKETRRSLITLAMPMCSTHTYAHTDTQTHTDVHTHRCT